MREKRFIFHVGIPIMHEPLIYFCANNRKFLLTHGVAYPNTYSYEHIFSSHTSLYNMFRIVSMEQQRYDDLKKHFVVLFSDNNAIIMAWNDHADAGQTTKAILDFFNQHFPRSPQEIFLVLPPQEKACARWAASRFLHYKHTPSLPELVNKFRHFPSYLKRILKLEDFSGREHLHLHLLTGKQDADILMARELALLAGLSPENFQKASLASPPWISEDLPRDFLHFASACNEFVASPGGAIFPWYTQAYHFTHQSGYPAGHSLLGPHLREEIRNFYDPGNQLLARKLGLERLFPDPEPELDWEPFTGLTIDSAFKVAERLDRDFAFALMAEFDATPIYYLTREHRLCRQALHDVLDPPFSAPLIRAKAEEPKLSVLTLTYNHAAYIAECIESVIAQKTDFPIQHIIADDASDDGTQGIILDYAARYPHIVPVFRKKRYCPENIRALFDMARTEYVAICDGDDYFTDPAKLQSQVNLLDANRDAALCFHVVRVIYEGNVQPERLYPPDDSLPRGVRPFYYLSDLLRCNLIQSNSAVYRWRFRNGLPDWFRPDLTPGDWYWHLLHAEQGKIGFINKIMSVYRRHEKGVYWLSEVDAPKHRATVGMRELEVYDVINKHFDRKFESILLDLTNGVFADCLLYDTRQKEEAGADTVEEPVLNKLCDKYPDFARHFLASLKLASAK